MHLLFMYSFKYELPDLYGIVDERKHYIVSFSFDLK